MRLSLFKFLKRRFDSTTHVSDKSRVSKDSRIGRYCYVGNYCDITRADIGNYVSIANNVTIGPGEHALDRVSTNSLFYSEPYAQLTAAPCRIGSDAWIGVDAIVRRGVTIGIGAAVGANSFVNADVPDFAIVAGSPARLIGYRLNEAQRAVVLESRWWEQDIEVARRLVAGLEETLRRLA